MPIYEFYCRRCNTIYNFFSRSVNTEKVPDCPKCKNGPLKRKVSLFAALTGRRDDEGADDGMPPCLLYTSDAADDLLCVDLGGRRIIKKKQIIISFSYSLCGHHPLLTFPSSSSSSYLITFDSFQLTTL